MSLTYLASPYSHKDQSVMVERFDIICEYAAELMRNGLHIYSPIAHTHPIAQYGLPKGWEYWEALDTQFLKASEKMIVYMMDGWEESKGIAAEIKIAISLNIPVEYHHASS